MNIFCLSVVFLCLTSVLPTHAERECSNGAKCSSFEECEALYWTFANGRSWRMQWLALQLHCGFNDRQQPMICCPPELASYKPESDLAATLSLLPRADECGVQYDNRIVNGQATAIDDHPWMVLLRSAQLRGNGFYCGGALISSRYVLTAAHCVRMWRVSSVRLGEWKISSPTDCVTDASGFIDCNIPPVDVSVEEVIVHEGYNVSNANQPNDIALLRLAHDVLFNDFVKPICLPVDPLLKEDTFEGYDLVVAGWGKTETGRMSDVKMQVLVPVMKNSICSQIYTMSFKEINENQICAGGRNNKDSCGGDSGGPLMGQFGGRGWTVLGVVSFGPSPCGMLGWPGVYTRVPAYVDWILSKLRP
ncbi:CLIP domain-containing serine protease HP8 [Bicyclus anynana]|uniref:CLIP domain-containing serine protease HP8 n=1 Tax=Bicyclus anynana TaxID=110368 RepID=A0A6J1N7R0_BICAN|nr:CLIP domain-containing serine protease HP8 [Bicyclus anynana]